MRAALSASEKMETGILEGWKDGRMREEEDRIQKTVDRMAKTAKP
jgi:hypothetical protein